MKLALFDVDGTLLLTPDLVAVRAILDAIDPTLPDDAFTKLDHAGRTALSQVTEILGHAPEPDWCARAERRYEELLGDTSNWRAPDDAVETLAELRRHGVSLALLTGSPERIARIRMQRLGLAEFFPDGQGAFGCESESRIELIDLALARAGARPDEAVEIGDTPADRETALAAGVGSILVEELESFRDLVGLLI
jgi:phosphoglycolate phosphatase